MSDGKHHGWSRSWSDDGRLLCVTHLQRGMLSGPTIEYDVDGDPKAITYYVDNQMFSESKYKEMCDSRPDLPKALSVCPPETAESMVDQERASVDAEKSDRFAESMIRAGAVEARAWLSSSTATRTLGVMQASTALEFVDRLYSMGASRVIVSRIVTDEEGEHSSQVFIELPKSASQRQNLFRETNRQASVEGFDDVADCGQRYLYYKM